MIDIGTALIVCTSIAIIGFISLILFVFSIYTKNVPVKIFSLAFSFLMIILMLGIIVSLLQNEVTGFTQFSDTFSQIYYLFLVLGGIGVIGLIVWLVYMGLTLFNKSRGTLREED